MAHKGERPLTAGGRTLSRKQPRQKSKGAAGGKHKGVTIEGYRRKRADKGFWPQKPG